MATALCERSIWPTLYAALVEVHAHGVAVYDVVADSSKLELAGIWLLRVPTDEAEYKKIDESTRAQTQEILQLKTDMIYPHGNSEVNAEGERWWSFILATGAVRKAGYVVSALVAAKDVDAVKTAVRRVRSVFATPNLSRL